MFLFQNFIALVPLIAPILAIPSSASSPNTLFKRDDCHGSGLCQQDGKGRSIPALNFYLDNKATVYTDYTSYVSNHYTAIYECPKGYYPPSVTGSDIYSGGQLVLNHQGTKSKLCTCGSHWMLDSRGLLKCRITLNYCHKCTTYVNGFKNGNIPPSTSTTNDPAGPGALESTPFPSPLPEGSPLPNSGSRPNEPRLP
ncbi:hypothetical protein MMC13_003400 [Lambiella insularis]|nr:hypothetical protein [Lambiella insularis]